VDWQRWSRRDVALGTLLLVLIAGGVYLRLHAFNFPDGLLFDEHHFVENARNYLGHQADWNDHPPLGKLLIAASIRAFGDNPIGWRAPALLLGCILMAAGGLAAARLFRSARAGWLAAALLAMDGFLIAYSRAGLLDGYLAAAAVLAILLASCRWTLWTALAGGLLGGAACGIKFNGGGVLVPLSLSLASAPLPGRKRLGLVSVLIVTAVIVYIAQFSLGLAITRQPASASAVVAKTWQLLNQHAGATEMKNPWVSGWPTWALPWRTVMLGYVVTGRNVRALTTLGNLVTWWASVALALALGWQILWRGVARVLRAAPPESAGSGGAGFLEQHGRATLIVLSTALGFLAPWVLTHRDSYIYHFLPSYAAIVLLLGAFAAWQWRRRSSAVLAFAALVLAVGLFYAPLWSFFPIAPRFIEYRLFLPSWR
jgi:dolichyl-phosphate-mannose--protein O-mannosyl transferase